MTSESGRFAMARIDTQTDIATLWLNRRRGRFSEKLEQTFRTIIFLALAKGSSSLQELEENPQSGLYILVKKYIHISLGSPKMVPLLLPLPTAALLGLHGDTCTSLSKDTFSFGLTYHIYASTFSRADHMVPIPISLNWTELNWTELNWNELNWNELTWPELN